MLLRIQPDNRHLWHTCALAYIGTELTPAPSLPFVATFGRTFKLAARTLIISGSMVFLSTTDGALAPAGWDTDHQD
jgi:hypothetical protein